MRAFVSSVPLVGPSLRYFPTRVSGTKNMFVILIVSIGSPFKSHSLCASEALLETHDVLKMCIADVSKPRHVPRWTIHGVLNMGWKRAKV